MESLRGRTVPAFSVEPHELVLVKDREHPLFDERVFLPVDESMIASIMTYGVCEPVICRRNGTKLEVLDGRQRVKASIEANKRLQREGKPKVKVTVVIRGGVDRDVMGAAVTVNEIRRPDAVLLKAAKAQRMMHYGYTVGEVAVTFGTTIDTIENYLKLNGLHKEIRSYVARGKVRYTVAMRLAALPREEQVGKLRELLRTRASNANAIRAVRNGELERVTPPTRQQLRSLADTLLKTDGFLATERGSDVFSFTCWILGRISTEELLSNLSSSEAGSIGDAVKKVMNGHRNGR